MPALWQKSVPKESDIKIEISRVRKLGFFLFANDYKHDKIVDRSI